MNARLSAEGTINLNYPENSKVVVKTAEKERQRADGEKTF
jgi:hypothetical protein